LSPAAQGRGAGLALMTAVADHARARGFHTLMAGISGENAAGIAFHAAYGFVTVGVVPESGFTFGRFIDLVLMQKRI
jgi:L-amino acid N-acyltransferase